MLFAWIFFRAENFNVVNNIILTMLNFRNMDFTILEIKDSLFVCAMLFLSVCLPNNEHIVNKVKYNCFFVILLTLIIVSILIRINVNSEFLYFQF